MATKAKSADRKAAEEARAAGEEVPIESASDGGDSRLTKGYSDNPDKPAASSVAQVEELVDEESG